MIKFIKCTNAQFTAQGFTPVADNFYYVDGSKLYLGSHELTMDETDPIFSNSASFGITSNDISKWNTKQDIIQYTTMPTASEDNLGQVVQYIGLTTNDYTQGYFYICSSTTENNVITYNWETLDFIFAEDSDINNIFSSIHVHSLEHHSDIIGTKNICTDEYDLCTADGCNETEGYKFNQHYNSEHNYGTLQYKQNYGLDVYYVVCSICNRDKTLKSSELANYTEEEKQAAIDAYEALQGGNG